jgi:protein-serine/threonine kinase
MHAKKIVHRDLKLENLLLDRNRNIIITDFGFANRYADRVDDLMATSCGSPCYAAPELVVQDGKYVGTAVDVWSCGVILYAMLAGYLPFDDDPANPDGDNINLLYKYIINTPLSFPDWITPEPRDLLCRILVPDPLKRAPLEEVMHHPWLRRYRSLFERTVPELERMAAEHIEQNRKLLEKQKQAMLERQNGVSRSQSTKTGNRHHSAVVVSATASEGLSTIAAGTSSHRQQRPAVGTPSDNKRAHANSAMVVPSSAAEPFIDSRTTSSSPFEAAPTMVPSFSAPPMSPLSETADAPVMESLRDSVEIAETNDRRKRAQAQRHTVQVEYDSGGNGDGAASAEERRHDVDPDAFAAPVGVLTPPSEEQSPAAETPIDRAPIMHDTAMSSPDERAQDAGSDAVVLLTGLPGVAAPEEPIPAAAFELDRPPTQSPFDETAVKEPAAAESLPREETSPTELKQDEEMEVVEPSTTQEPLVESVPAQVGGVPLPDELGRPTTPAERPAPISANGTPRAKNRPTSSAATEASTPKASTAPRPIPFPSPERERKDSKTPTEQSDAPSGVESVIPNGSITESTTSSVKARPTSRHRKGMSTDKFFLSRLLGGHSTSPSKSADKEKAEVERQSRGGWARTPSSVRGDDQQQGVPESEETTTPALDEVTNKRKGARRKALSLVVEPFGKSSAAAAIKARRNSRQAGEDSNNNNDDPAKPPPTPSSAFPPRPRKGSTLGQQGQAKPPPRQLLSKAEPTTSVTTPQFSNHPSQSKAKRVMDWFRWKTLARDPLDGVEAPPPITTDFDGLPQQQRQASSTAPVADDASSVATSAGGRAVTPTPPAQAPVPAPLVAEQPRTPTVVVTGTTAADLSSQPSSRSASGGQSHMSEATVSTTTTSVVNVLPSLKAISNQPGQVPPPTKAVVETSRPHTAESVVSFSEAKLRWNTGAFSDASLTQRSPPAIMADVRKALWALGIDTVLDGDFKYRCIRKSKKKAAAAAAAASAGLGLASGAPSFGDHHSGGDQRLSSDPPSNFPTSPSGGFRALFARKGSSGSTSASSTNVAGSVAGPAASSASPSLTVSSPHVDNNADVMHSPTIPPSSAVNQPPPFYGEPDSGAEVRFSVEVGKVDIFMSRASC